MAACHQKERADPQPLLARQRPAGLPYAQPLHSSSALPRPLCLALWAKSEENSHSGNGQFPPGR